ncbi:MAG: protoporphyrinogen oxidase [Desulfobulbaceae bacterium]|jgi:oxygen-dependent protoporphyrinogen oxidase|nr:protoporphyrinogen oxidase [Desulfobulbaceae bacterium]
MDQIYDTLIIGGGLSGLSVGHFLKQARPGHSFAILEAASRPGGVIKSHRNGAYLSEQGPHGFLDNCPESQKMLRDLELDRETVTAPLAQHVRYVYLHGRLNLIPQSPGKIIVAPLISWPAKLRVLAELWQKPLADDATVAEWVGRRFGRELLPYADAVFTGTWAGDYQQLLLAAVMPGLRALETEHGSVLRGLIKMMRARKSGRTQAKKPVAMPAMTSFPDGMERLPQRLAEEFTANQFRCDYPVTAIGREDGLWRARSERGDLRAAALVVALPVNAALRLLRAYAATPVEAVPEAFIKNIVTAFSGQTLPPGFGYLAPEAAGRYALGSLFSSNMFAGRAASGQILCETLVGGRRHPERYQDDGDLGRALADIRETLGLRGEPVYAETLRPLAGIPQLEAGANALLAWRGRLTAENPGLFVCGFGWNGIGVNDMIKTAKAVATARLAGDRVDQSAEVKKIYF